MYGENCVILASTVLDWSTRVTDIWTDRRTDRQTDGIAIAYTRYSYAVVRKNYRSVKSFCWFRWSSCLEIVKTIVSRSRALSDFQKLDAHKGFDGKQTPV